MESKKQSIPQAYYYANNNPYSYGYGYTYGYGNYNMYTPYQTKIKISEQKVVNYGEKLEENAIQINFNKNFEKKEETIEEKKVEQNDIFKNKKLYQMDQSEIDSLEFNIKIEI